MRDAQSFYDGFSIRPPPSRAHPPQGHWPGFGGSQPSRSMFSLNSTNFLQIPQILRALPVRDVIHTL